MDNWFTGWAAEIVLKASFDVAFMLRFFGDDFTTVDDDHVIAYSNPRGFWNWIMYQVDRYATMVMSTTANESSIVVHDVAISGHINRGAILVRKIKNAYYTIWGRPGIGSRWAFLMQYPFKPNVRAVLRLLRHKRYLMRPMYRAA